jgi:GntR family transcriptional regulator, N-acetylglucosamine utilization regulator
MPPLHDAIAASIEARVRAGEWAPGSRLAPERELCRSFDVSRSTLRLALAELEDRGLVTRQQGRGTFVARPRVQADVGGFFSLRDALAARGIRLETQVLDVAVIKASRSIAQELGLLPSELVVRVERLRSTEGQPLVIDSAHLPVARFPDLESKDLATRSLYDILRQDYDCHVATAAETLEPVILTPDECGLLGVTANAPALLIRRLTRDRDDAIVELATALLRGDRARLLLQRRSTDAWLESVA